MGECSKQALGQAINAVIAADGLSLNVYLSGLKPKAKALLELIQEDPWRVPPSYERLVGDLSGAISRRINIQHRLVYQVLDAESVIKVLRLWTHYE